MKSKCRLCGKEKYIASILAGYCVDCIREKWADVASEIMEKRNWMRRDLGLPPEDTSYKSKQGIPCKLCVRECVIGDGEYGYCGLRKNVGSRLQSLVSPDVSIAHVYLDPHVTNCCAAYFCPAGTGLGFPKYAYRNGPEYGYYNLAYFFYGCSFSCVYCQNHSLLKPNPADVYTREEIVNWIKSTRRISCICWVGGTPEPQLPFALKVGKEVIEEVDRIVRLCYEWNGTGNWKLVEKAGEQALVSGGIIKFDLKAWSEELNIALSGYSNKRVYENFRRLFDKYYNERREIPLLTATTLLVPGYIDSYEVECIAKFLSELDKDIPYSLLIFHPDNYMRDLPITPKKQVQEAYNAAKKYLSNVNIGNIHLLALAPEY